MIKNLIIILLLLISGILAAIVFWNATGPVMPTAAKDAGTPANYDVRLTLAEEYLVRRLRAQVLSTLDRSIVQDLTLDIQPNNILQANGSAQVFGLPIPFSVTLRLLAQDGSIRTEATEGSAGPIRLPQEVLDEVQAQVNQAISEAAPLAGTGLAATGLETGDNSLTLFMRAQGR